MNPQRFFDLADMLGQGEAEARTAVNRYYYSVFNYAKRRLSQQGVPFQDERGDHVQLKDNINQLDPMGRGPSLESLITTLYERRETADYRLEREVSRQDRQLARGEAEQIVERIGGWP